MPQKNYDVFFSYTRSGGGNYNEIIDYLMSAGLRVFWDETEIDDFKSISNSIVGSLISSKVLVAYYSKPYLTRPGCEWEFRKAFLAGEKEGDPRRRILVINPENDSKHILPTELKDAKYFHIPKAPELDQSILSNLTIAIKSHLENLDSYIGEIEVISRPVWHLGKPSDFSRFVGRTNEMWELHTKLNYHVAVLITGDTNINAPTQIIGLGGIGKTMLAKQYASLFADSYPGGVFWLRAHGNEDVEGIQSVDGLQAMLDMQLLDIAKRFKLSDEDVQQLKTKELRDYIGRVIKRNDERCLWVVDDMSSGLTLEQYTNWYSPHPIARTLITTRAGEYNRDDNSTLKLEVLSPNEAYTLITSRFNQDSLSEEEKAAVFNIIEKLGFHPLAIDVAGAAIKYRDGSFITFIANLEKTTKDELNIAGKLADQLPTGHENDIATTLLRSIMLLEDEGMDFLRLASQLAVEPIPVSLISETFKQLNNLSEDDAQDKASIALKQADSLSLATRNEDGAWEIHVLVSRTMRFYDTSSSAKEKRNNLRDTVIKVLSLRLADNVDDIRKHDQITYEVTHTRQLVNQVNTVEEAYLANRVARYDYERGAYILAEWLFRREMKMLKDKLGEEHPYTLSSVNNLAETLSAQGNFREARKLLEKVLGIRIRLLGEEHPSTLKSMGNLASTQMEMGEIDEARKNEENVMNMFIKIHGKEHPDTLTSMNNLAGILRVQGDLKIALELQEKVLEIRERLLGKEHPHTLNSTNNLALTLRAIGDFKKARRLNEKVLEIRIHILGEEHPDTLTSMNNLAEILRVQGDLKIALELQEKVLEIRERLLGKEHPHTLNSTNNLALTLHAIGDFKKARRLNEKVLEIRIHILGEEHPDTLQSMNNLALTLTRLGDLEGSRRINENVLAICNRVFGKRHSNTTICAWNLYKIYLRLNEDELAVKILDCNLLWLPSADREKLSADQRMIRTELSVSGLDNGHK